MVVEHLTLNLPELRKIARAASRDGMNPPVYLSIIYPISIYIGSRLSLVSASLQYLAAITLIPIIFAASTNLIDDYYDWKNEIDTPFSGSGAYRKHPVFALGLNPQLLLYWGLLLIAIATVLVVAFSQVFNAPYLLLLAPSGAFISYGYTGPPIGLKYRGLSELTIASSYLVIYYVCLFAIGHVLIETSLLLPLPIGLIFPLIILSGHLRDIEEDRAAKIKTLEVELGKRGTLIFSYILLACFLVLSSYIMFEVRSIAAVGLAIAAEIALVVWLAGTLWHTKSSKIETSIGNLVFALILIYFSWFLIYFLN